MSSLALWIGVGALGGVASIARFLLGNAIAAASRRLFPLGTLAVNLSGSVVLGVLVGAGVRGDAFLLAGTALIGSYTTFSAWILESHRLAASGARRLAVLNVGVSLVLGVAAVALGRLIAG